MFAELREPKEVYRFDPFEKLSLQGGASSLAKHRDVFFSAVYGSIKDPIAAALDA